MTSQRGKLLPFGDDDFLRGLGIKPFPEYEYYQETIDEEKVLMLFTNDNNSFDGPEFNYYDENPNESPFINEDQFDSFGPEMDEDTYKSEVSRQLATTLSEFMAFSTVNELFTFLAKYI